MTIKNNYKVILTSSLILYSCHANTKLEKCNPEKGRFIDGQHFVLGKMMNDNKRMNYHKWYKQFKDKMKFQANCIPIERKKSLTEKLDDLARVADLSR